MNNEAQFILSTYMRILSSHNKINQTKRISAYSSIISGRVFSKVSKDFIIHSLIEESNRIGLEKSILDEFMSQECCKDYIPRDIMIPGYKNKRIDLPRFLEDIDKVLSNLDKLNKSIYSYDVLFPSLRLELDLLKKKLQYSGRQDYDNMIREFLRAITNTEVKYLITVMYNWNATKKR